MQSWWLWEDFQNWTHFVLCLKIDDASYIAEIYFKHIIRLHGVPETIVSNQDSKFLPYF